MNCPNCSSHISPDQQYCRACGIDLVGDRPAPVNRRVVWGLVMMFGGIIIALASKALLNQDVITLVGVLISIAGMFVIAAYPILFPKQSTRRDVRHPTPNAALAPAETTNKLPPMSDIDFVPSVTEKTTDLLRRPNSDRRAK